jgi:hypothetical protein
MPVTALDPTTALIVVDLQAGLAGLPTIHPFDEVVGNAAGISLRAIARQLDMTSPAVHYYFPSRQAPLDALIVDGFTSLAGAAPDVPTCGSSWRPRPAASWLATSCMSTRSSCGA